MNKIDDLSILITSYNNAQYIADVIDRVSINFPDAEIMIIDDCSTDNSWNIIKSLLPQKISMIRNSENYGYGFALYIGTKYATKKYIAFQDSDLEYEPCDIRPLYWAITEPYILYPYGRMKKADVAYGRRTHYGVRNPISFIGRTIINGLFYILYGFKVRDFTTAYKVMPRQLLLDLDIQANDFSFGVELTVKLLRKNHCIIEVPISYYPRTTKEGKSIRFRDGLKMIWEMLKWRVK